ncbi:MAG: flagellar filament capping protein FliD, partial [Bacilli bacterium]|nr:flagellar filament capping protein FliD [Bacilli bacterium]
SLRRMVTDNLGFADNPSTIKDISTLGVTTTDKSGKLSFDSSKFLEEFNKDSQNVINFFNHEIKDADNNSSNVGFISKLNDRINDYISSKDGLIKSKNESFDRSLKDLNRRIDSFNDRITRKEEYYTKMFAALDVAMMEAESQMSWLTGQISAMNAQTATRK